MTSGAWHGYAWTETFGLGATISPADFSAIPAGDTQLCANGTVVRASDASGAAALGINLGQDVNGNRGEVMPTGTGIRYSLTNAGASPLRIQIWAMDGDTNPNHRWCTIVTESSGTIPWSNFNTQCGGTGTAYDGKIPLASFVLLVPDNASTSTPFAFCIRDLAQVP